MNNILLTLTLFEQKSARVTETLFYTRDIPLASTIIAIALIPVAFLFTHAYFSGLKNKKTHSLTGMLAIIGDLSVSISYMLYRTFGGEVAGSKIILKGPILSYFIVHGLVSLIVIIFEIIILITGLIYLKTKKEFNHKKLGRILFFIWWFAFLSGELFYLVYYIL